MTREFSVQGTTTVRLTGVGIALQLADILDRRGLSEEGDESDMDHEELCRKQPGKHRHISCDPIEEVRAKERVFGEKLLEP